jgi:hypothetical protein
LHRVSGETTKVVERSHLPTRDRLRNSRGLKRTETGQRFLGIEKLAARLDQRFRMLVSKGRAGPSRQWTLRAAIDWSYDLLSSTEQLVFERLSTCRGGWTRV